jgi:1-deoxy-D-xylulose-5-phosphate synthase
MRSMLHHTADHNVPGIVAVRYPREAVPRPMEEAVKPIEWGTWEWVTNWMSQNREQKPDAVLLAVGTMVTNGLRAVELLASKGINVAVVNARFVKPLDEEMLADVLRDYKVVFTAEEGQLTGGFGQTTAAWLLERGFHGSFKAFGIEDAFTVHGDRKELMEIIGLDSQSLAEAMEAVIEARDAGDDGKRPNGLLQKLGLRRNGRRKGPDKAVSLTGTDPE